MYQLRGIIDHQTNPAMARSLRNLMGLFRELDGYKKTKRQRRSSESWTCSDLAIIVREYDYVINLLETINTFIQEEILDKFNDQLDDEVRNFVNRTLTVYTEAETQLKMKRGPFVQYQTELGCLLTSSIATTSISATSEASVAFTITTTAADRG